MNHDNRGKLMRLLAEHKQLGIGEQIDYQKFYLYSIITHSTAIEGSTVTEVEAQLLFDEGITSSKRTMMEQLMNLDLKAAYEYGMAWIMHHRDITVHDLQMLAAKVMEHTGNEYHTIMGDFSAAKGELRLLNVTAGFGGSSYMAFQKVPARLEVFCAELNMRRKRLDPEDAAAIYDLSFWAHYELVTIHPWADGNGRTCRLLMNLLQMEYGVLPAKVLKEDKADYIQALIDARGNGDVEIFVDCMTSLHIRHLASDIDGYRRSMDSDVQKDVQKEVTERQRILLRMMREDGGITLDEMSKRIQVSQKTVQREIDSLRKAGIIARTGGRTHGEWVLLWP